MGFYHKTVETQVHRPLRDFIDILAAACHVGRVAEERQIRIAAAELDGKFPLRFVAVLDFVEA